MGNPFASLASLFRKPEPLPHVVLQPRCTCGRFCSTHPEPADTNARLAAELMAKGINVPAAFRHAETRGQG